MAFGESLMMRLGIDDRRFARGMRNAERSVGRLRNMLRGLGLAIGTAVFVRMARNAVRMADEIEKAGQAAGVSAEEIQKLRFAEEQATGSSGAMDQALQRLGRRMVSNERNLNELGVATRDANGNFLTVRQTLDSLAEAIRHSESQAERLNLAQEAMGTQGRELVPLLQQGAEGLSRFGKEAEEAGRILEDDTIEQLSKANQAIDDFSDRATVGMGGFLSKLIDINDALAEMIGHLGAGRARSEQEAQAQIARATAIARLRESGEITLDGRGRPNIEGGIFSSSSMNRARAEQRVEELTNEILIERARMAREAEKSQRKVRDRTERAASETERAAEAERKRVAEAERLSEKRAEEVRVAREVAEIFKEAAEDRAFQELPAAERIQRLEQRITEMRERAADADTEADDRIDAANAVVDAEEKIARIRAESAREQERFDSERERRLRNRENVMDAIRRRQSQDIEGFSLSELAREGRFDIGINARQALELRRQARFAAMGGQREFAEDLIERAREREQLIPGRLLRDPVQEYKEALRETETLLDGIRANTKDFHANR